MLIGPHDHAVLVSNRVLTAKYTARLAITPTTAAVTPVSAAVLVAAEPFHVGGAQEHEQEAGHERHPVTSTDATMPATQGSRAPGLRYAPRNATNCTTMISGPGVVSARASPRTISPGASQA
jgi:hypothetical protein